MKKKKILKLNEKQFQSIQVVSKMILVPERLIRKHIRGIGAPVKLPYVRVGKCIKIDPMVTWRHFSSIKKCPPKLRVPQPLMNAKELRYFSDCTKKIKVLKELLTAERKDFERFWIHKCHEFGID